MQNSKISWTTHTFNPWIGCTKVSPACDNCYAEGMARRMHVQWGPGAARRMSSDEMWAQPFTWARSAEKSGVRARVFCSSMADVFEGLPEQSEARARLWNLIEETPWLDWLLLTKRPNKIMQLVPELWRAGLPGNVWTGATCENQEWFDKRMAHLAQVPAAVRWISAEPLLGPIDISAYADKLDWIVAGGESSAIGRARRTEPAWARDLLVQAKFSPERSIPFHWKQWGHQVESDPGGLVMLRAGQKKNPDRRLEGQEWNEYPEPGFTAQRLGDAAHRGLVRAAKQAAADTVKIREVMTA